MPRRKRIVIPGLPHHVTQRGNYRQTIFREIEDFKMYCYWINKYTASYGLDILAYCLMNNHVHFIIVPRKPNSLALTFNTVHMQYAQYFNKKWDRKGHLWQGRFFSCIIQDDAYLYRVVRYVEQNPVRAGIVKQAWDYDWSSARWHTGSNQHPAIHLKTAPMACPKDWKKYLQEEDPSTHEEIRTRTHRGLVVGEQGFIASLERRLGISLKYLSQGRPRKGDSALFENLGN